MNELSVHNFIFNTVAGIVQIFIKSWNQLLYPRVIEFCRLHFEQRHDYFWHLIIVVELAVPVVWIQECGENPMFHLHSQWSQENRLLLVRSA